jgi:hypothetical protein
VAVRRRRHVVLAARVRVAAHADHL